MRETLSLNGTWRYEMTGGQTGEMSIPSNWRLAGLPDFVGAPIPVLPAGPALILPGLRTGSCCHSRTGRDSFRRPCGLSQTMRSADRWLTAG